MTSVSGILVGATVGELAGVSEGVSVIDGVIDGGTNLVDVSVISAIAGGCSGFPGGASGDGMEAQAAIQSASARINAFFKSPFIL